MNLHEECLLKYLINPLDLFYTTELLKLNNNLIERGEISNKVNTSSGRIAFKTDRI